MDEGTKLTESIAIELQKPLFNIELASYETNEFKNWIEQQNIRTLNIAGPRESNSPGIYISSLEFLESIRDLF